MADDQRKITALILLDFSKAFDSFNHSLLIHILSPCGFGVDALLIFEFEHKQSELIEASQLLLSVKLVFHKVPFLDHFYSQSISAVFSKYVDYCKIQMYAHDVQLYYLFAHSDYLTDETLKTNDLSKIMEVFYNHSLILNHINLTLLFLANKINCHEIERTISIRFKNT